MEPIVSVIHRLMKEGRVQDAEKELEAYGKYQRDQAIDECAKVVNEYQPDEGLTSLNISERMTLELVSRKVQELKEVT